MNMSSGADAATRLESERAHAKWPTGGAIFIIGFATFAILNGIQPLMPVFATEFGVSAAESSLVLSLTTLVLAIGMLGASTLSDIFGPKRIIATALVSASLLCMGCGLAPDWLTLLGLRSVLGLALAGLPSVTMAYVSSELGRRGDGAGVALYIAGTTLGGLGGRYIVAFLADIFDWRIALEGLGGICLIGALAVLVILPRPQNALRPSERNRGIDTFVGHLRNRRLLLLYAIAALMMGGFVSTYNALAFYLEAPPYSWTHSQIGLLYTAYLAGTVGSVLAGLSQRRFGFAGTLIAAVAITAVGTVLLLQPEVPLLVSGLAVFTFGFFAAHATASGWVGVVATRNRAQAAAMYLLSYYIGSAVISTLGGLAWTWGNWAAVLALVGCLLAASFACSCATLRA